MGRAGEGSGPFSAPKPPPLRAQIQHSPFPGDPGHRTGPEQEPKACQTQVGPCAALVERSQIRLQDDQCPGRVHVGQARLWLDRNIREPDSLKPLLRPCPGNTLQIYPVSTKVNSPENDRESVVIKEY